MNVYGSQLWCFNNYKSVECFYIAWRKTIRRIWRLDKRTHNVLINLINRCLPITLIFRKKEILSLNGIFIIIYSSHELHKTIVKGVTMTLYLYARRVSVPSSLLDLEVMVPCGYSVPCQI